MPTRPVWAEISLDRLTRNYDLLRGIAAAAVPGDPPGLLAVVKANAYGHGVEACGPALAAAGANWLGVTSVEEGVTLRRALGVLPSHLSATRILVMSSLWHGEAEAVLDRGLTPQVWEPYQVALLAKAAAQRGAAPASVAVHLEIDTGMARQGVAPGQPLTELLARFSADSPLAIEAVMTHLSAPEQLADHDTDAQLARFGQALTQIAAAGVRPSLVHAGNSATVFDPVQLGALSALAAGHGARLMLRPGLALYGYPIRFTPQAQAPDQSGLHTVLAWKTRISSLRTIAAGQGAGYNSTFRATRPTRLALTPVGYADGLNRLLSNKGAMLVHGRRAPIAGRISMDQTLLDVTEIADVNIGDEVVILGEQGSSTIDAWEHAELCGTIPYEILCNIAARVPRTIAG